MIDTSTAAIAALMDGVTPGDVRACNMVHADRGDQMTAEEIGEYVAGCVRLGDPTRFLFLAGKDDHGSDVDVCHIGNGPRGPANARFLAACFGLVPALAAERDALRAEVERLREELRGFLVLWAVQLAKRNGWSDGELHPAHYDRLKELGARMDDFRPAKMKGSSNG